MARSESVGRKGGLRKNGMMNQSSWGGVACTYQSRQNGRILVAAAYSSLLRKGPRMLSLAMPMPSAVSVPSIGAAATIAAVQPASTPRKSKSAPFPGHCLTANTSIHTIRRVSAPVHAAATKSPQRPPQQWLKKIVAAPVNGRTPARSAKRHRPLASVSGFTKYCTTSQVLQYHMSSSYVSASRKSIRTPQHRSFVAWAGLPAVAWSSASAASLCRSSDAMMPWSVTGESSRPFRHGCSSPPQYL
mmetsp:Transcript_16437/g.43050  ORF Transcript_16437/g.43050 Transcript_16437/m.43050 type:complete len:245 (-) Transcript_16437:46-780(-)